MEFLISILEANPEQIQQTRKFYRLRIRKDKLDDVRINREGQISRFKYMITQEYDYLSDLSPSLDI